MIVPVEVPPDLEESVKAQAAEFGVSLEDYLSSLITFALLMLAAKEKVDADNQEEDTAL